MRKTIIYLFAVSIVSCMQDSKLASINNSIDKSGYNLSQSQKSAITALLRDSVNWRLSVDSNCINRSLPEMKKEDSTYHPFYAEGDFNVDGKRDFAIAINRDSITALYWFTNLGSSYSKAELLSFEKWYNDGGFQGSGSGYLGFGYFYSDVVDMFAWNEKTHKFGFSGYADEMHYDDTTSAKK
jgi:hypothetical protein